MSLHFDEQLPFAYIADNKNNRIETLSFIDNREGIEELELDDEHTFQLVARPTEDNDRATLFVAGESGSGKSYFIREYAKRYNSMFPKNEIFLISYLDKDKTLDAYKKITRLNCFNNEFMRECLNMKLEDNFQDSLVIFDDIDCIVEKKAKERIYALLFKMLKIGRHTATSVAYLGHELYHSPELKTILNESMTITIFPRFLNFKKLRYLLEEYLGLSKEQIAKIRTIKDRSVTYIKGADKIILSDHSCFML